MDTINKLILLAVSAIFMGWGVWGVITFSGMNEFGTGLSFLLISVAGLGIGWASWGLGADFHAWNRKRLGLDS